MAGVAAITVSKPTLAQEAGVIQLQTIEVQTTGGKGPRTPVKGYIAEL